MPFPPPLPLPFPLLPEFPGLSVPSSSSSSLSDPLLPLPFPLLPELPGLSLPAEAPAPPALPLPPDIEGHKDSFDILGWDYQPGDVLLFHGHILHGATGGITLDHPRRAHASMWAGPDVHYVHRFGQVVPDPKALYELKPKTGQALGEFPEVFPVAWAP